MLMVFYAVIADQSIARMFCAGLIPGIALGLIQMVVCAYYAKKDGHKPYSKRARLPDLIACLKDCWLALLAPLLLIGTILGGVCTPTEGGALACFYCFIVGMFIYKTISWKDLPKMLLETALMTGTCFLIVSTASLLAWLLTAQGVSAQIGVMLSGLTEHWMLLMTMFILVLLFFGTFMESIASLIILVPIFLPLAVSAGIDPIHLGLVMVLGMDLAMITPPVGICLFIAMRIANLSLERLTKAVLPFLIVSILVLMLIAYVPELVMFLPRILNI